MKISHQISENCLKTSYSFVENVHGSSQRVTIEFEDIMRNGIEIILNFCPHMTHCGW